MYLDVKGCPLNKSLAEHISEKISVYVRVAEFVDYKKKTIFRLLIDPDLTEKELADILCLQVAQFGKTYKFFNCEGLLGPVVDHQSAPHQTQNTMYLRVTYVS